MILHTYVHISISQSKKRIIKFSLLLHVFVSDFKEDFSEMAAGVQRVGPRVARFFLPYQILGKIYRMTTKCNKWPQLYLVQHINLEEYVPDDHKIYKMATKYTNYFHCKALQNEPKLGFLGLTIWQPWCWQTGGSPFPPKNNFSQIYLFTV
jgi:hypothetical protein